jgi:hypothetical protein
VIYRRQDMDALIAELLERGHKVLPLAVAQDRYVESGGTVIYRRQDMDALIAELQERGHKVLPLAVAQDRYVLDSFVDVPPYHLEGAHLKLELEGYVVTSVGIVVERGA